MTSDVDILPEVAQFKALFEERQTLNREAREEGNDPKKRERAVGLLDQAKGLATAFVEANPSRYTMVSHMSREQAVSVLTSFREAGAVQETWLMEMWILAEFEPVKIGGTMDFNLRRPGEALRRVGGTK